MDGISAGDWATLAVITAMSLAPLIAVTVLTYRWRRRGWWLAAPWALLAATWLLVLQLFYSFGRIERPDDPVLYMGTGMIAAWLALTLSIIGLSIVGPRLSPGVGGRS